MLVLLHKRRFLYFFVVALFSTLFLTHFLTPGLALAADKTLGTSSNAVSDCTLRVRVVKGDKAQAENGAGDEQGGSKAHVTYKNLEGLDDVQRQLDPLPFAEFKIIDSIERPIKLNTKEVFNLKGEGNSVNIVSVTPHSLNKSRVQLTVDWREEGAEEEFVSTQMAVLNGESLVLGTDSSESTSTILCVRINCQ